MMALWARIRGLDQKKIRGALNESRLLVRTSCMRQTLHLLPSSEFEVYIAALKRSRVEAVRRVMSRFGITDKDVEQLNQSIIEGLSQGPKTQRDLSEELKAKAGKRVRAWMDRVWSVFKLALAQGLVCYGPDLDDEPTLVRADRWLPRQKRVAETEAKRILLRRYLTAYGPATLQDFSKWSGIPASEATPVWTSLRDELSEVSIERTKASILTGDRERLLGSLREPVLRLLPGFDPYLLGHTDKSHLVDDEFYKRVYRNQGWISPVVLLNGRAIGIWAVAGRGKDILQVELFAKASKVIRKGIETEAERLGIFLGTEELVVRHSG
jgi:uncharacterized protein YcaQ